MPRINRSDRRLPDLQRNDRNNELRRNNAATEQPAANPSGAQAYADAVRNAAADGKITTEEARNIREIARSWNAYVDQPGTRRATFEDDMDFSTADAAEADRLAAFMPRVMVDSRLTRVSTPIENFAQLSWTPPTKNTDGSNLSDLSGYKIYYGRAPGQYDKVVDLSDPTATSFRIENLAKGTWYFAMKAVNNKGEESALSGEVYKTIK